MIQNNIEVLTELIRRTKRIVFSYAIEEARLTYLNNAFIQVWKRTRESVMEDVSLILNTIHPDDRNYLATEYQDLLNGELKNDVEFRIILPDGSTKWLLLDPLLIVDMHGKKHVTGTVEDITVVKDNLNNVQKFGAKKDSILEILSHDLAGPLANIQGLTELLAEYTKDYNNEELSKVIRIIRESNERNILLIRNFVQHEFLESSNVELFKRRVNLVSKLREVVEQYKEGENHIKKEIRFSCSLNKVYAYVDDIKFMQVINNLFSNAIKFTPDFGTISLELTSKERTILITLQDNGIGIPEKYHSRLFEKFTPARREGLRGEPSTGLGMSIIKTIVEWHNGKIWFESEEKVGTTFYIELPKE